MFCKVLGEVSYEVLDKVLGEILGKVVGEVLCELLGEVSEIQSLPTKLSTSRPMKTDTRILQHKLMKRNEYFKQRSIKEGSVELLRQES